MINTVNFSDFCDSFSDQYKDNFSYEGKKALFDYLEELEVEIGEKIELDTVALCCDYTEYESLKDLQADYSDIKNIDDLRNRTQVIEFDKGIIIQQF